MDVNGVRRLIEKAVKAYFTTAAVVFGQQNNRTKPKGATVVINTVSLIRPQNAPEEIIDGYPVRFYPTTWNIQIDLLTNGSSVAVGNNQTVPMENTAINDLTEFANFVNSYNFVNWCHQNDIAVLITADARDTSSLVNSAFYQYRATMELAVNFTQRAVGFSGILDEDSVWYPEDETEKPQLVPSFTPTTSGGGTEELANKDTGYFTEVEIKSEEELSNGKQS